MADWPREIKPEDRIKYLIQARADFRDQVEWTKAKKDYFALTPQEEALSILPHYVTAPDGEPWLRGWDAFYSSISDEDNRELEEIGNFPSAMAARKGLSDYVVVVWAVRQAWEDVGG